MCRESNHDWRGTTRHHPAVQVDFLLDPVDGRVALPKVVEKLVASGALLALVNGSQVFGRNRPTSDPDRATYCAEEIAVSVDGCSRLFPADCDLPALNEALLEFKSGIAARVTLLLDTQQGNRVKWVVFTRRIS